MNESRYVCNLCGSDASTLVWDKAAREEKGLLRGVVIRDDNNNIIHSKVVMCMNCGLVYTDPKMTLEELDKFYKTKYRDIYNSNNNIDTHMISEAWHSDNASQILYPFIVNRLPELENSMNFLDIGASTLRLCTAMKNAFKSRIHVYAVEPSSKNTDIGIEYNKKNNFPIEFTVYNGKLEDFKADVKFDLITCLNSLEHMHSPVGCLRQIRDLLNDNGILLLAVPNLFGMSIDKPVDAWLSCAHLYHFSPPTLSFMALSTGFSVLNISMTNEEVGEKIYIVLQKADAPSEIIYNKRPNIELLLHYLISHDSVHTCREALNRGGLYLKE